MSAVNNSSESKSEVKNVVVFGSARPNGNTRSAINIVLKHVNYDFVDLSKFNISPFDYEHKNIDDDFIDVVENILNYENIILATPVYWYSVSTQMKIFLDRWSDILTIKKELGQKFSGKNLFVISSYATEFPLGCSAFETPIRLMCDYMNINYGGCFYYFVDKKIEDSNKNNIIEFQKKLSNPNFLRNEIIGDKVSLRLATLDDRKNLFEWMYCSDTSKSMWSGPIFPEKNLKTWEEFKESWELFYYQYPLTNRGHVFLILHNQEAVGGIAFHRPDERNRSEIDIWLRSEKDCGQGIGKAAINLLCKYLYKEFGIMFFWVMPSSRNPRSIAVFQKCGFKRLPLSPDEGKKEFGFQDYHDSVYLLKDMSLEKLAYEFNLGNQFTK